MKKILITLLFLSGCSSKPLEPVPTPSYERLSAIKSEMSDDTEELSGEIPAEWLARTYLSAGRAERTGNKLRACMLFKILATRVEFPLNQTALVHTLSDCKYSSYELKKLWKETAIASYLKESYLDISLNLATKNKIDEYAAEFSYELVPFKQVQSEKVKLLKHAIELAKKLDMPDRADKYLQKLTEVSPLYLPEVTKEKIYLIAKDFESNRQFEKARDLYLDIINGDFTLDEKIKAYNSYRISFKISRDLKMFMEKTGEMELFLRQLLEASPEDVKIQEAWVDAKTNYARAVWTEHMNAEARLVLDEILERKVGSSAQLATLYWVYGSLHIESKENNEALEKFETAAEFKVSSTDQQENIQWAVVWNKYLLKKYPEAIVDADKFIKKSSNPNFIYKLNFWKARSLEKLNRADEARTLYLTTANNDQFGYYGLIAAMKTQTPLPAIPPSEIVKEPFGNLVLDWLIAMDEKAYSTKVLKEINSEFKTIAQRERAMSLYGLTGWYQGGMTQIYNFPTKMRDDLTKKHISVVFPTPYKDIFSDHAYKYYVPLPYPYAIARQESAFNPNVRSWADAFGLMQLIPEKALELSKRHGIPYKEFNDLYQPDINVEMGTVLLSELRTLFKGKFAQSTAAYNASTDVIAVWEKERFNGDYLEFIEMIPYEETRNYIKFVFRNYITYRRVLGKKEILIPENFFAKPFN